MPINTAVERRAVAAIGDTTAIPGVTPDATPGKMWRATVGWGYFLVGGGGGGGDAVDSDQVSLGKVDGMAIRAASTSLGPLNFG